MKAIANDVKIISWPEVAQSVFLKCKNPGGYFEMLSWECLK